MLLFVGLGNPGKKYEYTRHNMGFRSLDYLFQKEGISSLKSGFQGTYIKLVYHGQEVIFLKPETFMNLSGNSVIEIAHFFKIKPEEIIVIYDDMDTEVGKIRLKEKGSSGGQKGMQSIINVFSTENIKRIKVGIGRPELPFIDYVLSRPRTDEEGDIQIAIERVYQAINWIVEKGFHYAQSRAN